MADQHGAQYADDLSCIVGRLERDDLEGGFWALRFGDEQAPHGGRVVLGNPPEVAGFNDGDLVRAHGRVAPETMSIYMAGTMYELSNLEPAG